MVCIGLYLSCSYSSLEPLHHFSRSSCLITDSSEIIYKKIAPLAFFFSYEKPAAGPNVPAAKWYNYILHKKLENIGYEPFKHYYRHFHIEAKCTIAVTKLHVFLVSTRRQLVAPLRIPLPEAFLLAQEVSLPDTFASLWSNIRRAFGLFCFYYSR